MAVIPKTIGREIVFIDYPQFRPNLTPREIFQLGSFGGTYWRPIYSRVNKRNYTRVHEKFPNSWWRGIPEDWLIRPWDKYDKTINRYGVKVGTTLEFWESKKWITRFDPYGWVQWYCNFYEGRRTPDDERQINRWLGVAGPNGRFRRNLSNQIRKKRGRLNDFTISPAIRQTLQHWAYILTADDHTAIFSESTRK